MCLLIHKPKHTKFTYNDIADYYAHNPDGFGLMWAAEGRLHTIKVVGTLTDIWRTYTRYAHSRECAMHFRMRTHGDINDNNCHPYMVTPTIGLMHNGILSTGNADDTSKSDTWHYIDQFLKPLFEHYPKNLLKEKWFKVLISDHIGHNNRFLLMDATGETLILNRHTGLEYRLHPDQPAAWFSNTYAWTCPVPHWSLRPTSFRDLIIDDLDDPDDFVDPPTRTILRTYR